MSSPDVPDVYVQPPAVPILVVAPPTASTLPVVVLQGPQGPPGTPGASGASGAGQVFTFPTPASTWSMSHHLGRHPVLSVYDLIGPVDMAYVDDKTTTTITWDQPTAGSATIV